MLTNISLPTPRAAEWLAILIEEILIINVSFNKNLPARTAPPNPILICGLWVRTYCLRKTHIEDIVLLGADESRNEYFAIVSPMSDKQPSAEQGQTPEDESHKTCMKCGCKCQFRSDDQPCECAPADIMLPFWQCSCIGCVDGTMH